MITILADATAGGIDATTVGMIIASVVTALLGGGVIGKKITESRVQIANNPLDVDVRKEYVTRAEFTEFKADIKTDIREIKGLYHQTANLINTLGEGVYARIKEDNDEAGERRRTIHDKIEKQGREIAAIQARTDVSKSIGKLGAAMMTALKQPN